MLPNAALKSLHSNCLCSLPLTTCHPGIRLNSLLISSSDNFRAGISHLLRKCSVRLLRSERAGWEFGADSHYESAGARCASVLLVQSRAALATAPLRDSFA